MIRNLNINKIAFILLAFPFLSIFGTIPGSDTALHIPIIVIFIYIYFQRINKLTYTLILLFILTSVLKINEVDIKYYLRILVIILSMGAGIIISQNLLKKDEVALRKLIFAVIVIYLSAGIIQIFFPSVLSLVVQGRGSASRGLSSLASEPSSFALNNILLISAYSMLKGSKSISNTLYSLTIVLSLNFVGFAVLFISFIISRVSRLKFKNLLSLSLIFTTFLIGITYLDFIPGFGELRITNILKKLISNPEILLRDSSANRRVSHIVYPLTGLLRGDFVLPTVNQESIEFTFQNLGGIYGNILETKIGGNIMSGFGFLITAFGIFSLYPLMHIIHISSKIRNINLYPLIVFSLCFLNSISISWLSFSLCLSIIMFKTSIYKSSLPREVYTKNQNCY